MLLLVPGGEVSLSTIIKECCWDFDHHEKVSVLPRDMLLVLRGGCL